MRRSPEPESLPLIQILAIAAGGAVGAVLRFWLSTAVYAGMGRGFPYGTLAVNVLGSLLMGLLYALLLERMDVGPEVRAALLIGVLGAFTTFSTFSIETLNLIEQADYLKAVLNAVLSVLLCLVATWGGLLMSVTEVTMVRIYLTEGQHQHQRLMTLLHDEQKVCGVTTLRGISGFGRSGRMHSSSLLDISLDLPLVLEFFDRPERVAKVLEQLDKLVKPGHLVSWPAYMNMGD